MLQEIPEYWKFHVQSMNLEYPLKYSLKIHQNDIYSFALHRL